jgi:purine nucleosidase
MLANEPVRMKRKLLIDTDTASDDAVALIMALHSPAVEVVAITAVAGNVDAEQATRNARFTVELCDSNVPVFLGAARPLVRNLEIADWFHGADGLGDHSFAPIYPQPEPGHSAEVIVSMADRWPGLELITLGPLTNLALALELNPHLANNISRCVVMGGAPCCEGNVTPAAEFNFWADPEAASKVFRSGLPIEMVGWQLSRGNAVIDAEDVARILALDTDRARFAIASNSTAAAAYCRQTGEVGIALPDPVAMAILLDPNLCLDSSRHYVDVETASSLTRGMSVVDRLDVATDPRNISVWAETISTQPHKIHVCWQLDVSGWKRALLTALQ